MTENKSLQIASNEMLEIEASTTKSDSSIRLYIFRALGITLMVLGHSGIYGRSIGVFTPFNFIYLFHMSLFFFYSGYFFSRSESEDSLEIPQRQNYDSLHPDHQVWDHVLSPAQFDDPPPSIQSSPDRVVE